MGKRKNGNNVYQIMFKEYAQLNQKNKIQDNRKIVNKLMSV